MPMRVIMLYLVSKVLQTESAKDDAVEVCFDLGILANGALQAPNRYRCFRISHSAFVGLAQGKLTE